MEENVTVTNILDDIQNIDINGPDFYENVQSEIDADMARMKKTVEVMMNLRLTAAEVEVETAALFHAELWYDLLNVQNCYEENSEEEVANEDKTNKTDP